MSQDADWAADGESMAVVRYVPENNHWRLEYPIGKVLLDGINWISHPKISPDGKYVAFADHENPNGDDEGSVAVIGPDGKEKKLSSGWTSVQGILLVSRPATRSGSPPATAAALPILARSRSRARFAPSPMSRAACGSKTFATASFSPSPPKPASAFAALAPGAKEERELGWFGWAELRDISRDGHKIIFEEEGDGGGPNYTVFLRDTDGSPPSRIGEGVAEAISPDGKFAVTEPAKNGFLTLVPTGAGQSRQLTHDAISFTEVHWMPDGKHLLASGIEAGHGARDYLIDIATGESKPITPEGTRGVRISPDGAGTAVRGPDGNWGVWSIAGGSLKPIPGLGPQYAVAGWAPDGKSVYVLERGPNRKGVQLSMVDVTTGKMEPWKLIGAEAAGASSIGMPRFSADLTAYAYMYVRSLSQAYVVKGLQ